MQFKIGDLVVHPAYGVGHIVNIESKQFIVGAGERPYYELTTQKNTVWVPVEAQGAGGLRSLTAKTELARYRSILKSPPGVLNKDHRKRNLELTTSLKQGSFQVVCEVVRDLTASHWRRPLNELDTICLRRARETLYQEWAGAAGISRAEAVQEIEALLTEGRLAHLA